MHIPPTHRAALKEAGFKQIGWRAGICCTQASWARGRERISAFEAMPGAAVIWTLLERECELRRGFDPRDVLAASQARPQ